MHFFEWFTNLKSFLNANKKNLTDQVSFKLNEIIEFVEQYTSIEKIEIPMIPKEIAMESDKKRQILKL
jgi:hypothetical protein